MSVDEYANDYSRYPWEDDPRPDNAGAIALQIGEWIAYPHRPADHPGWWRLSISSSVSPGPFLVAYYPDLGLGKTMAEGFLELLPDVSELASRGRTRP